MTARKPSLSYRTGYADGRKTAFADARRSVRIYAAELRKEAMQTGDFRLDQYRRIAQNIYNVLEGLDV